MGTAAPDMLADVLQKLESTLLRSAPDVTDEQIESLLAEDFHEIGASGRRFDRAYAVAALRDRRSRVPQELWTRSDEHIQELQPGLALFTYRLQRGDRVTMRATIWRRTLDGHWRAVFHQGTLHAG